MKVSIITAVYNGEQFLNDSIRSVKNQTYQNIEQIFVDGLSTDNSLDVIKKYLSGKDKLISEKDNGIYNALNKGVSLSTGDIIGFAHSDDILSSNNIINEIVGQFVKTGCDAVYGDIEYISKKSQKRIRYWKSSDFSKQMLVNGWMPPHPSLFVKRKFLSKDNLFNENYKISADYEYILRLFSQEEFNASYIPMVVTKMRLGGASNANLSKIILKMKEDYVAIKNNNVGGIKTLILKNLRKTFQFFSGAQGRT